MNIVDVRAGEVTIISYYCDLLHFGSQIIGSLNTRELSSFFVFCIFRDLYKILRYCEHCKYWCWASNNYCTITIINYYRDLLHFESQIIGSLNTRDLSSFLYFVFLEICIRC